MAGIPVVVVNSGGIPVVQSTRGAPAKAGTRGIAVTLSDYGGMSLNIEGLEPPPDAPTMLTPASITAPNGFVVGEPLTGVPATFSDATSSTSWWALGVPGSINAYWRPYTGNETIDCPPWPDEEIYFWTEAVNGTSLPTISQSATEVIEAPTTWQTETLLAGTGNVGPSTYEGAPVSLGIWVRTTLDGREITHIIWHKPSTDTATARTVQLRNAAGTVIGSGSSTGEPAGPAVIEVALSSPVAVTKDTYYKAIVHSPSGYLTMTEYLFQSAAVTEGAWFSPANASAPSPGNGMYKDGASIDNPDQMYRFAYYGVGIKARYQGEPPPDPPSGYPDATNTGTSGTLTPMAGGNLSGLIENRDITGNCTIVGDGTVLRNCRIVASGMYHTIIIAASGVTIEDCEIDGLNGTAKTGIYVADTDNSYVIRRCNIHGVENGIDYNNNGTIEDNYIWGFAGAPGAHFDGIEANGGSNIIVRHNTVWINSTQTSGIMLNNYFRGMSNVLVEQNKIVGGNTIGQAGAVAGSYPIYCDNSFSGGPIDGATVIIRNNTMQRGSAGSTAFMALYSSGAVHYGNTNWDTGAAID